MTFGPESAISERKAAFHRYGETMLTWSPRLSVKSGGTW